MLFRFAEKADITDPQRDIASHMRTVREDFAALETLGYSDDQGGEA